MLEYIAIENATQSLQYHFTIHSVTAMLFVLRPVATAVRVPLCFNTHYAGDDKMKEMQRAANESAAAWQRRLEEELQRIITISQLRAIELERAGRLRDTATKME